jgi:hypothetical protein
MPWKILLIFTLLLTVVGCGQKATTEVQATKNEDVIGIWLMTSSPTDSMHPTEWYIEHTTDGARNYTIISGSYKGNHGEGKYWFEDGLYKVQISQATEEPNSTSVGTYKVFVTKKGDMPIQLRFVVVDDPYEGRKTG